MKQNYIQPATTIILVAPTTIIAVSDIQSNVALPFGGGSNQEGRTKDSGDWDIWGEEE